MAKPKAKTICEQCGQIISKSNYKSHIRRHLNHPETFVEPKYRLNHDGLTCQFCGRECKNRNSLCNHERLCKENPDRQDYSYFENNLGEHKGKGHKPWSNGLTKETDARIAEIALKVSASLRGVPKNYTDEQKCTMAKKMVETKKKNGTLNSSKAEDNILSKLIDKYGINDVKHHYIDVRYPYECDFYVVSEDMFIEINFHWTHGGKPYNPEDESCQKQLKVWNEKAKTSKYFENAIDVWTRRDVNKLKTALNNNLRYVVIYTFDDLAPLIGV